MLRYANIVETNTRKMKLSLFDDILHTELNIVTFISISEILMYM